MKEKNKFSDLINQFSELWLEWMKQYNISINDKKTSKERRTAGEMCERLIMERYENIEKINNYFEN